MKIQFLTGVSSTIGSYSKGQVAEVENRVAEQWLRANWARSIGAPVPVVHVAAAPVPVAPPVVEPAPVRRGGGRRK